MDTVDTHLNHLQGHFRIAYTFLFIFFDNHSLMLYSYMALESYKPHIRRMVERRVQRIFMEYTAGQVKQIYTNPA